MERGRDCQTKVQAWNPSPPTPPPQMMLDGAPLPTYASIKDFQHRKARYVADVVDQALLLPKDMVDLRTMKKHEVFLSLKRDLVLVSILCVCVYIYTYIFYLRF